MMIDLDTIDVAYLELDRPLLVVKTPRGASMNERKLLLQAIHDLGVGRALMLPNDYTLEVIGPAHSIAPPFELARWADDGGRV